jgi:hypothetical protein
MPPYQIILPGSWFITELPVSRPALLERLRDYPISDTEVIDVVKGLERLATMPDAQSWDCVASFRRGLVFADGEEAEVVAMMWSQHVAGVHDLPAEITGRDDVIEAVTTSGDPSYRFFTEDGLYVALVSTPGGLVRFTFFVDGPTPVVLVLLECLDDIVDSVMWEPEMADAATRA